MMMCGTDIFGFLDSVNAWSARRVTGPTIEPITPAELVERARLSGADVESSALLGDYIAAARDQVEQDTGCALLTQTIAAQCQRLPHVLPWPPLQTLTSMSWVDSSGGSHVIDPATYSVDAVSIPARLAWSTLPTLTSPRAGYPYLLELVVGWIPETLPPALKQAVGLLASHYLTAGRDRVAVGAAVTDMIAGYREAIAPYTLVVLI